MSTRIPSLSHELEWRHARTWIGRRLVLRQPWLGFDAGTPCRVLCVVDFGDGILFWLTTDEAVPRDVDQVTRRELEECFRVAGHRDEARVGPALRRAGSLRLTVQHADAEDS